MIHVIGTNHRLTSLEKREQLTPPPPAAEPGAILPEHLQQDRSLPGQIGPFRLFASSTPRLFDVSPLRPRRRRTPLPRRLRSGFPCPGRAGRSWASERGPGAGPGRGVRDAGAGAAVSARVAYRASAPAGRPRFPPGCIRWASVRRGWRRECWARWPDAGCCSLARGEWRT